MMTYAVAPNQTEQALAHVRNGGRLVVRTPLRTIVIDAKTLAAFERVGSWLLKADGDGYRLKTGKTNIYLLPGQLEAVA